MGEPAAVTQVDPRVERSRALIIATATQLLVEGGVHAVTVEAVTGRSGVARSTVYRHFPTSSDMVAAAFDRLIPAVPEPPSGGGFADRLLRLMLAQAAILRDAPTTVLMTAWLVVAADGHSAGTGSAGGHRFPDLQRRMLEHHRLPLAQLLHSGLESGELRPDLDVDVAVSQLGGPLVFRKLISGEPVDDDFCRRGVADFLRANLVS